MKPHLHTISFQRAIERDRRLPAADKARLLWLAWIHFSSRSGANFRSLLVG